LAAIGVELELLLASWFSLPLSLDLVRAIETVVSATIDNLDYVDHYT